MIETIDTPEGLAGIADDWRALAARFPTPLLQHDWFTACAHAFCPPEELQILLHRRDGRVTAIAPLSFERQHAKGRLEILGSEILCEPSGLLYERREDLEELLRHIVALQRPTILRRLPAQSPEVSFLESENKGFAFQAERQSGAPWIPITLPWSAYEQTISSKSRYTLRRARKRADMLGAVEFESRAPGKEDVQTCFGELAAIESRSWKEKNGTSIGTYVPLNRFFSRYMRSAAEAGILRVTFLRINGEAVAFLMGVVYANRFWVLKISFAESFAHCSPGVLLMHEVIRGAFDSDLEAFEFLGTDEPWLHTWTNDVHAFVGLHLYPFSFRGLINLGSDSTSYLVNRLSSRKHKAPKD
jgi:CelD/BcsL family acetyltransferase involved in cellulose biosynthesis